MSNTKRPHPKILLIRFSSIGDVTQTLCVATRLSELGELHWATRIDMAPLLANHPSITKVWTLDRRDGITGLLRLMQALRKENFTHVYDAHNNMRSNLISFFLRVFSSVRFLQKSQKRWKRFLLFNFGKNLYEMPFSGQRDLLEPLTKWGLSIQAPAPPQIFPGTKELNSIDLELKKVGFDLFVALVPSAAYPLKKWPEEYFKKLIEIMPSTKFVLLGSQHDKFLSNFVSISPDRVVNFAGRLSLMESVALIQRAQAVVANDTGPLHFAEQLGKKTLALMGPAPFGFPSRPTTRVLELDLSCRPCSKHGQGPCTNEKYQRCLVDITPEQVKIELERLLL